jgi:hypothetical protein
MSVETSLAILSVSVTALVAVGIVVSILMIIILGRLFGAVREISEVAKDVSRFRGFTRRIIWKILG